VKKLKLFAKMLIEEGRFTGFLRDCLVKMGARSQLRWTPGRYAEKIETKNSMPCRWETRNSSILGYNNAPSKGLGSVSFYFNQFAPPNAQRLWSFSQINHQGMTVFPVTRRNRKV